MRKRLITCTGLALVMLVALSAVESVAQDSSKKSPPKSPKRTVVTGDGSMNLKLKKGLDLKGTPLELESIKMTSIIGEIDIPLHTIAGVKFPEKTGEPHTVVLHNGDSLTGDVQLNAVKIVSAWGEASVNSSELTHLVFGDDLRWTKDTSSNNGRWRLSRVTTPPPGTRSTSAARPTTTSQTQGAAPARVFRNGF